MLNWMYSKPDGFEENEFIHKFKLNENEQQKQFYLKVFKDGYLIQHIRYDENKQSHWYCLTEKGFSTVASSKRATDAKIISWIAIIISVVGLIVSVFKSS